MAIPLGVGLAASVLILIIKLPDILSWRRARHKEVFLPIDLDQVLIGNPPVVVDLRDPADYDGPAGHIRGAYNITPGHLLKGLGTVSGDRRQLVVLVDGNDKLSHAAADVLRANGYTWVRVLQGGMRAWRKRQLPVSVSGRRA